MDLIGMEIFDVGKWNDQEFTDDDLNNIVAAFDSLSAVHHVPLKLGHNEEQPVSDGQPALGWVNRIYRQGSKLVADFVNMPTTVYEAVKSRLYRTVSVELLAGVRHKDSDYPWVLDAVALLGADQPAVNTLADLDKLMASRIDFDGRRMVFSTARGNRTSTTGEISMDDITKLTERLDALDQRIAERDATIGDLRKENEGLKASVTKFERDDKDRKDEEARAAVKTAREGVNEVFERAIKGSSITPAQRQNFEAMFGVADDEKVVDIDLDTLAKAINAPENPVNDDKQGFQRENGADDWKADPEGFIHGKVLEFQAKHDEESYAKALSKVGPAYPEAWKAYHLESGA